MKMDQPVPTNNVVVPNPTISTKAVTPRMILGPQVIGARPGQPGVFEYTSEFSEFLKKSTHATRESATAAPLEPSRAASPSSSATTDDAKNDDVAQSQDSILSSPTAPPSSTVLVNPSSNQSQSDTATNNLIPCPQSSPDPFSPEVIVTSDDRVVSRSGSELDSSPKRCPDEEISEGMAFSSASPPDTNTSSVVFDETHADIMIFPKMSSTSTTSSPPRVQLESECVVEESLYSLRESDSPVEYVNKQDENKAEESCDRSLQLQPSESALFVPFEEQLLENQNPSPDLELISHAPEPEVVLVKEAGKPNQNDSFRESFVGTSDTACHRYSSSTVQFSQKPCHAESFKTTENSVTPEISFTHQTPELYSTTRSNRLIEDHRHVSEGQSQLQIQILPYSKPSSTQVPPYHHQDGSFNSKSDVPVNTFGAHNENFSRIPSSDVNYNHLTFPPQIQTIGSCQPEQATVHPLFTTDPRLHSQFLEYAENHPLGHSPRSMPLQPESAMNKAPSIPHPHVMTSHGPYFQQRRNSIPNDGGYATALQNPYGGGARVAAPGLRPPMYSQYNSSFVVPSPSSPTFISPLPDGTKHNPISYQNSLQHQQTRQSIPHDRSQFDHHHFRNNQNYRPPVAQLATTQLSPRLKSPTSPHPRVASTLPWIPSHNTNANARIQGQALQRPIEASIFTSSNMEVHNRATTGYYRPQSSPTQLPVQMGPIHGNNFLSGSSPSNTLQKPFAYTPTSTQYAGNYLPTSSQSSYHHASGIPSYSSVVGQIPPILGGSGQSNSRPSPDNHHQPSFVAHQSSSAQHPMSHSIRDSNYISQVSQRRSSVQSGYYGNNQNRVSGGSEIGQGHGTYPSIGYPHPHPVVCRVTPIPTRLDMQGQEKSYHRSPTFPKSPFNPPSRMPPPFSEQHLPLEGSVNHHQQEYDSYNSYSCQYNDAMRRLSTQFTLQALPGLPPGAQGHHLLVKTENGQYQLLRVGPPPTSSAPTAATGTAPPSSASQSSQPPTLGGPNSTPVVVQLPVPPSQTTLVSTAPPPGSIPATVSTTSSAKTTFVVMNTPQPSTGGIVATSNVLTNTTHRPTSVPVVITPPTSSMTTSSSSNTNQNHSSNSSNLNPNVSRLQTPSVPPAPASNSPSGVGMTASISIMSMQHQMQPHPVFLPPHPQALPSHLPSSVFTSVTASSATIAATATTVSQMTPDTAKQKCKNFLSFLLELSAKQNQTVARNVRGLIQGLVDGKVNAEDFSDRLQREVNSQPQPCLVGFLKKSLPPLRQSLANKDLTIDGIRPPPLSSLTTIVPPAQSIISTQVRPPLPAPATPVRIIAPINTSTNAFPFSSPVIPSTMPIPRSTVAAVQQRFATPPKSSPKSKAAKAEKEKPEGSPLTPKSSGSKGKDKKSFASSGTFGGDDDINDVAAMGGVNLAEESQRILGSTELIGTQIRSCQDEPFIKGSSVQGKIKFFATAHGFDEPPPEVAVMISHAAEEHIKTMLEKLALIAEHRLDVIKLDERYEVTQDVKGQLRFLEELEKLERKRHDEQEREMLIKAAKSRSKSEDPEQAKLKAKAKEMQRVAQEELRQREANLTALQAIGPRKKPKLEIPTGSQSTTIQNPVVGLGALSNASRPQIPMRPRLKRVSMRDVLFLLESDGETRRSEYLYKQFLK